MKKLLIVTHIRFWRKNGGDVARLSAIIQYLSAFTELTVVFGGSMSADDLEMVRQLQQRMDLICLKGENEDGLFGFVQPFTELLSERQFDVCIIEHVFLSFFISFIPRHVKLILDTHDLVSDRVESFRKMNLTVGLASDLSVEQEKAYFRAFDIVMTIQKNEFDKVSKIIGREKTILTPHPVSMQKRKVRRRVQTIGFVASGYPPNVDAINWFLDHVWPLIEHQGVTMGIYGNVCGFLKRKEMISVVMNGYTADQDRIYGGIDIVINPVRCGAGLKIKNVEALGSGLPLVTTTHGAMGIEDGIGRSFLVADDEVSFSKHLLNLIDDHDMRQCLGEEAYRYALNNFSPKECFESLLLEINKPKAIAF